jgi:hypothetical protein
MRNEMREEFFICFVERYEGGVEWWKNKKRKKGRRKEKKDHRAKGESDKHRKG